jgi:hypothetical protein
MKRWRHRAAGGDQRRHVDILLMASFPTLIAILYELYTDRQRSGCDGRHTDASWRAV